ncbi:3-phosphoshikimate 1-carboxyvinyltransferase [bacterium]|nr:3-phosphoshikimate 1-carboxyvinyltransferase [bacterium]
MIARAAPVIRGSIEAPGDKSCSHRALMMAAVADGRSTIRGLLDADDVLATANAMAALGAGVSREGDVWRIEGVGRDGMHQPETPLDFGNSGTGVRLTFGLAAGYPISAEFVGDASLSARPMERVLAPLREMGAQAEASAGGRLPVRLSGGRLRSIRFAPPQASAQVKSAVLLAGLKADGVTVIEEKEATRDHTERMLRAFGVEVEVSQRDGAGPVVSLLGGQTLKGTEAVIPGDPSSAAFAIAAALIARDGGVEVRNVMTNPTRDGFFKAAAAMGADLRAGVGGAATGEVCTSWRAGPSALKGIDLDPAVVASMIDELPIFAVLAAFAEGRTRVTGAQELRVKESDRIKAICAMLEANGVGVEELEDGFVVHGCGPGGPPGGGRVETRHDHRIAMSALVMGGAAKAPVAVDDVSMIATSYRDFPEHMASLGARIEQCGNDA